MKSGKVRSALCSLLVAGLLATTMVASPIGASTASAATKTMSGQVMCSGFQKVERIWFLGSSSGWHGKDVPKADQVSLMTYSFTATVGETVQVWIDCTYAAEKYSSFKVGSGSTRHICGWSGLQVCASTSLAGCVLRSILANKINLVRCIKYL